MLLVGGEDHKTGQADEAGRRFGRLEAWTKERFPEAREILYRWSGMVLETDDGLAFIGRNPGDDNVFIATGDSGMGMTHGTIAGMLLRDLITGRDNPWAALYDPARKPWRAPEEFVKENLNVAAQYTDLLTGRRGAFSGRRPPRLGATVRRGLSKVALYRDEAGALHERSAVCPHLGCVVAWNSFERTWDCPCHGSRFSALGRVINAPPTAIWPRLAAKGRVGDAARDHQNPRPGPPVVPAGRPRQRRVRGLSTRAAMLRFT